MLSGAGMTSRLDRLEALKLIVRLPEVNDRRSLRIQLTSRGVRLIDKVVPAVIEAQWKVASALGPEQMRSLTEALGALTKILAGTAGR
jgi:DNA-binding MarR family transcriptional regulator